MTMKIYAAALLALCAFQSANGFVVQPNAVKPSLSLKSSYSDRDFYETGVMDRARSAGPRSMGGPLARRSAAPGYETGTYGRRDTFADVYPTVVQGGSLRTWSFPEEVMDRVEVRLETEGRPLNANVELWQGPDNCPQKLKVYIEDGNFRPFSAVLATPRRTGGSNTVGIRNTSTLEFPMEAAVIPQRGPNGGVWDLYYGPSDTAMMKTLQGGSVHTMPFPPGVESVQVMLLTDGRPLNAKVELMQGPNNNKQEIEIYSEDGMERPFLAVIDTPGTGNVIRVVNTATMEFPMYAAMEPLEVQPGYTPGAYDYGYGAGSSTGGAAYGGYDSSRDRFLQGRQGFDYNRGSSVYNGRPIF